MSPPLQQISCSPFFEVIEGSNMPQRFVKRIFTNYNEKSDPVKHVSHYSQNMAINSKNEALICQIFPSSLGLIAMRFDGLEKGSIHNYDKLTRTFGARFRDLQLSSKAIQFPDHYVHKRRGDPKGILEPILGIIPRDQGKQWGSGSQHLQSQHFH